MNNHLATNRRAGTFGIRSRRAGPASRPRRTRGFTLLELLVVVALVALWATMFVPAMARTQPNSKAIQCQNNLRRLTSAWIMYATDYNDALVKNHFNGAAMAGSDGWVSGWMDWTSRPDNTNTLLLRYGKLAPYFNSNSQLFKCPADSYRSSANLGSRVRSISMNASVGPGDGKTSFIPDLFIAAKMSDFVNPTPAGAWVLADENPDSINDGCLINNPNVSPPGYSWTDLPASYHNGGCSFSFADGHTEVKNWLEQRTKVPALMTDYYNINCPGSVDYAWLVAHTPKK